ncbi:hypothetical protein [Niabella hibiscisoli]|uniref:hypothetical protein n=1 Tax=Niabella hibiscisoli TaxID=1825928 RepID=UPI001F0E4160|nr:hypothetical protein [Niabella hibiscisoli]MCH5716481.1 hypothetical protein [Niabella hibiscisoli]
MARIYNAKKVIELEIAGFRIMSGLVEDFVAAALTPKDVRDKEHKKYWSYYLNSSVLKMPVRRMKK